MKRTRLRRVGRRLLRVKDLDPLARRVVFKRDGYRCVRCGFECVESWEDEKGWHFRGIQWAHVHTRNAHSIRHDSDNALTMCNGCHLWFDGKNPPFSPPRPHDWWRDRWPERDERLNIILQTKRRPDLEAIRLALENELER